MIVGSGKILAHLIDMGQFFELNYSPSLSPVGSVKEPEGMLSSMCWSSLPDLISHLTEIRVRKVRIYDPDFGSDVSGA